VVSEILFYAGKAGHDDGMTYLALGIWLNSVRICIHGIRSILGMEI
jgi:hypothetical protein